MKYRCAKCQYVAQELSVLLRRLCTRENTWQNSELFFKSTSAKLSVIKKEGRI